MIRKALRSARNPSVQASNTNSVPAPVRGWNTRDSVASMDPMYAILLDNWFPDASNVRTRKGAEDHVTGFASGVRSLMPYESPTVSTLFAVTNTGIFDATTAGTVGAAVATVTDGYMQHINFKTAAGSFLLAVNGVDNAKLYDGAVWETVTGVSAHAITGIATTELIHINAFKRRIWFIQKSSMSAWYLPVDSIAGAAAEFPLGQYFTKGGFLMAMGTWTIDGGSGVDDLAVFVSSKGEIAVFQGTDPTSATTFQLIGVYYIGAPLGRRCFNKYGGDLLYICRLGLFPLSRALQTASIDRTTALSSAIDPTFSASAESYGSNVGWEIGVFPEANFIFVNVPFSVDQRYDQYVMNSITNAWCRFLSWPAYCWTVFNNKLYAGGTTTVFEAWTGVSDFGNNITSSAQQAYSYLGIYGALKHFKLIRPNLEIDSTFEINIGLTVDFERIPVFSSSSAGNASQSLWDSALWDTGVWGADAEPWRHWYTVGTKDGYAFSVNLQIISMTANILWNSTDIVFEVGGVI